MVDILIYILIKRHYGAVTTLKQGSERIRITLRQYFFISVLNQIF